MRTAWPALCLALAVAVPAGASSNEDGEPEKVEINVFVEVAHSKIDLAKHYLQTEKVKSLSCLDLRMWAASLLPCDPKLMYYLVPAVVEQPFTGRFRLLLTTSTGHLYVSHAGLGAGGRQISTALIIGSPAQVKSVGASASSAL